jgi:soluble lytic murein transglycosylase-like protein
MRMPNRTRLAVAGAATVTALAAVTGVILLTGGGNNPPAAQPAANRDTIGQTTVSTTVSAGPATTVTTTTTSPPAVKTTTTTARKPPAKTTMPAPTPHPVNVPVPPPPHPAPVPGCAPTFTGDNAAKADVKAALLSAAGKQYWANASNPPLEAVPPPEGSPPPPTETLGPRAVITVPATLIEAIAWQESGWQSAIKACDGGVGTMQIMDATASWMNQRFGTGYTHTTLAGNTAIGAEYLEWLIAYFGENNFGHHYDITNQDLLTAVIVGYNAGAGAVQFADGHTVSSRYATTVKALMSSQPWG